MVRTSAGFVDGLKDKRAKGKNPKYTRLCSLDPKGQIGITKHAWTGNISLAINRCLHWTSETITDQKLAKILAALYIKDHYNKIDLKEIGIISRVFQSPPSNKLDKHPSESSDRCLSNKLEPLLRYYIQVFQEKTKKGKTAYKISLKAHHRNKKSKG